MNVLARNHVHVAGSGATTLVFLCYVNDGDDVGGFNRADIEGLLETGV